MCHLLGIAFMPRLKDLSDQHLYKLDKDADHGALEPLFRGVVDLALIAQQWDPLMRIAASLRDCTAPAHVVLQRLVNASHSHCQSSKPASGQVDGAYTTGRTCLSVPHAVNSMQDRQRRIGKAWTALG